jgi:hypothetical protein
MFLIFFCILFIQSIAKIPKKDQICYYFYIFFESQPKDTNVEAIFFIKSKVKIPKKTSNLRFFISFLPKLSDKC